MNKQTRVFQKRLRQRRRKAVREMLRKENQVHVMRKINKVKELVKKHDPKSFKNS